MRLGGTFSLDFHTEMRNALRLHLVCNAFAHRQIGIQALHSPDSLAMQRCATFTRITKTQKPSGATRNLRVDPAAERILQRGVAVLNGATNLPTSPQELVL